MRFINRIPRIKIAGLLAIIILVASTLDAAGSDHDEISSSFIPDAEVMPPSPEANITFVTGFIIFANYKS